MNMKFQPTPKRKSAHQNCVTAIPENPIAALPNIKMIPTVMTFRTPNRLMMWPVKKLGANMPTICHWITKAVSPNP